MGGSTGEMGWVGSLLGECRPAAPVASTPLTLCWLTSSSEVRKARYGDEGQVEAEIQVQALSVRL